MTKTIYAKHPTHHRCPGDTPVVHLTDYDVAVQAQARAEQLAADRLAELSAMRVKAAVAMQIIEDLAKGGVLPAAALVQRARECLRYGQ